MIKITKEVETELLEYIENELLSRCKLHYQTKLPYLDITYLHEILEVIQNGCNDINTTIK